MISIKIHECNTRNKFPFNIGALTIKLFQSTDFSHYAIEYLAETGTPRVFESNVPVSKNTPLREYLTHYTIKRSYRFDLNISRREFLMAIERLEGIKYSMRQNIGLGLMSMGLIKKNPWGSDQKLLNCNEAVLIIMKRFLGISISDSDQYDLVATHNILEGLKK